MNATWCTGLLRGVAATLTRVADDLDTPPIDSQPLEPGIDDVPPEDRLFDLRHRLTRYY